MNKNKIFILAILAVFCIGMTMSAVSASHTYNVKGYKFTVDTNTYNKILKLKKTHEQKDANFEKSFKTNKKKKLKVRYVSYYKKVKSGIKYYQYCKNGKSLGSYISTYTKPTSKDLKYIKKYFGGKITYKPIYKYKKKPVYKTKYVNQYVYAIVEGYVYEWDPVKDKGDYRPSVTFRTFPSNSKYDYLTMFFGTSAWL